MYDTSSFKCRFGNGITVLLHSVCTDMFTKIFFKFCYLLNTPIFNLSAIYLLSVFLQYVSKLFLSKKLSTFFFDLFCFLLFRGFFTYRLCRHTYSSFSLICSYIFYVYKPIFKCVITHICK